MGQDICGLGLVRLGVGESDCLDEDQTALSVDGRCTIV
jgi:hypothetical protein